jgi:hypothetical protein
MNVKEGFDAAKTALDSELHEGAAQRYERRGDPARAQTERLQAAAARGRSTDAEAEQHRADQEPSGSEGHAPGPIPERSTPRTSFGSACCRSGCWRLQDR